MNLHFLLERCYYFLLFPAFLVMGSIWNPSTDPLPPLQPAECGYEVLDKQLYHNSTGGIVLQLEVGGYSFSSYSKQFIQSTATGSNFGLPVMQLAFTNYTSQTGLLVSYNTQTCTTGAVEGNSPFPGYNFYQEEIMQLYNSGIQISFEYVEKPVYGVCLQYSAIVPWFNPSLPRDLVYTLVFQNSTGYLVEYSLVGTEYCCFGTNFYCPNSGNCSDGSVPQLTYASTNQTQYNYAIFTEESWSQGFFSQDCPFTTSQSSCNNEDDDSEKQAYLSSLIAVTVMLGLLLIALVWVFIILPKFFKEKPEDQKQLTTV